MVSASSKSQAGPMLPTTRCTNCQTVFELPPVLLESADTRVRCGECLCIFNARDGLIEPDSDQSESAGENSADSKETSGENSELDMTYSDFDLFSEEADLPALAYLDETQDTPEFDFDAVELGDEETFSDTLFSHDITIDADLPISESKAVALNLTNLVHNNTRAEVDFTNDKAPEQPLVFNYLEPRASTHDETQRIDSSPELEDADNKNETHSASENSELDQGEEQKKRNDVWVWCSGFALLVGVVVATVIYPRWNSLDQSPTFRPLKVAVCQLLPCEVDTRVSIDDFKVLKREVFESPNRDDALLISITIRNTAQFPQRYPVVEARMTNRVGRSLAQRAFRPADYLPQWSRGDVLKAGETVDIKLTVNDPGEAAEHHVLQLRELRLDCDSTEAADGGQQWPADCAEL